MRVIEERWMGFAFEVTAEKLPAADNQGRPVLDELTGEQKQLEFSTLRISLPLPDGRHDLRFSFDEAGKQRLLTAFTGGIVIPNGSIQL